nr:MAG TPA: hypothetical protein [Caudoviricetes sp.]
MYLNLQSIDLYTHCFTAFTQKQRVISFRLRPFGLTCYLCSIHQYVDIQSFIW